MTLITINGGIINLYDKSRIAQDSELHQLRIIEAISGSFVTAPYMGKPTSDNPSNVFGYVVGRVLDETKFSSSKIGDLLIDGLLNIKQHWNTFLIPGSDWRKEGQNNYLLVGHLNITRALDYNKVLQYKNMISYPRILNEDGKDEINEILLDYIVKRQKKKYVFKAPGGKKYPLEQILLSLEEQKD